MTSPFCRSKDQNQELDPKQNFQITTKATVLPGPDKHSRPHSPKTTELFEAFTATYQRICHLATLEGPAKSSSGASAQRKMTCWNSLRESGSPSRRKCCVSPPAVRMSPCSQAAVACRWAAIAHIGLYLHNTSKTKVLSAIF